MIAWVVLIGVPFTANAQFEFDFVEDNTGSVLGTLELGNIGRAELADVVRFDFTQAGQQVFGYELGSYGGEFDELRDRGFFFYNRFRGELTGRGDGGINNQASLWDIDPPDSSLIDSDHELSLQLTAGDAGSAIRLSYIDSVGSIVQVRRQGQWMLVPETSSCPSCWCLCCLMVGRQYRRSRS